MKAVKKTRPTIGDGLIALSILAAALLVLLLLPGQKSRGMTAKVLSDGELLWSGSLESLTEPVLYTVEGEYPLTLELSSSGVRVVQSACPGGDCRHTGAISRAGQQIVCLPNRTVVMLEGDAPSYDAVIG